MDEMTYLMILTNNIYIDLFRAFFCRLNVDKLCIPKGFDKFDVKPLFWNSVRSMHSS